jgi:hypothetical protein
VVEPPFFGMIIEVYMGEAILINVELGDYMIKEV